MITPSALCERQEDPRLIQPSVIDEFQANEGILLQRILRRTPEGTSSFHRDAHIHVYKNTYTYVHTYMYINIHKQDEEIVDLPTASPGFPITPQIQTKECII